MATDVKIMYGFSKVPLSFVMFNKKPFNPIAGHFLHMFSPDPRG